MNQMVRKRHQTNMCATRVKIARLQTEKQSEMRGGMCEWVGVGKEDGKRRELLNTAKTKNITCYNNSKCQRTNYIKTHKAKLHKSPRDIIIYKHKCNHL